MIVEVYLQDIKWEKKGRKITAFLRGLPKEDKFDIYQSKNQTIEDAIKRDLKSLYSFEPKSFIIDKIIDIND